MMRFLRWFWLVLVSSHLNCVLMLELTCSSPGQAGCSALCWHVQLSEPLPVQQVQEDSSEVAAEGECSTDRHAAKQWRTFLHSSFMTEGTNWPGTTTPSILLFLHAVVYMWRTLPLNELKEQTDLKDSFRLFYFCFYFCFTSDLTGCCQRKISSQNTVWS